MEGYLMTFNRIVAVSACLLAAHSASAVTIIDNFVGPDGSSPFAAYQNSVGQLSSVFVAGDTNVTTAFEADANYAASILDKAIGVNFTTTITIELANLTSEQAVGDSQVTSLGSNNLPNASTIRVDMGNDDTANTAATPSAGTGLLQYVAAKPADNSAFTSTLPQRTDLNANGETLLGGALVNVSRTYDANAGSAAAGKWDVVTLFTHEMEHSLAYTTAIPAFSLDAGPDGSLNRHIVIPTALTGSSSSWNLPIVSSSSHIDGTTQKGLFNDAVVADPGFNSGQRALLTAAEIYGACVIDGCTADQVNTNPYAISPVPEADTWVMLISGLMALVGWKSLRRSSLTGLTAAY